MGAVEARAAALARGSCYGGLSEASSGGGDYRLMQISEVLHTFIDFDFAMIFLCKCYLHNAEWI